MDLYGDAVGPNGCETDLIVVMPTCEGRVQLLIGECKTGRRITKKGVDKLRKVADAFPTRRFETFLLFVKLRPFTSKEIEICHEAQRKHHLSIILLSDRELEPYGAYEWASKEFQMPPFASRLSDMVAATNSIYFNPKRKDSQVSQIR